MRNKGPPREKTNPHRKAGDVERCKHNPEGRKKENAKMLETYSN